MESIGFLAAGIAHEINTPSQFIMQNLLFQKENIDNLHKLLSEYDTFVDSTKAVPQLAPGRIRVNKLKEKTDADFIMQELPNSIDESLSGIEGIIRIVKSIKKFSHTGDTQRVLANINTLIQTVVDISKNEWKYDSEVQMDLDENLPQTLCNPDILNQAFLNIVVNSAHANSDRKQPDGKKSVIRITTASDKDTIIISIQDQGVGIPDEIKDNIFTPFYTTKGMEKGTGQGLPIAYRALCEDHKGTLDFTSERGKGTTFTATIPIKT